MPDAAALTLQVAPASHEAGLQVLQAGQLDLELALMAARALGKDFQDQQSTVIDRQFQMTLQIALLGRAERLVEEDLHRTMHMRQGTNFVGLASTDEKRSVRGFALTGQPRHGRHAGGLGQQAQLLQLTIKVRVTKIHPHQQDWRAGRSRRRR